MFVHDEVLATARRHPHSVAVESAGDCLTYADLAARSAELAADLVARGVGPDVRVAIGGRRTPDVVVAVLATARAGGASVPLDLSAPPARLAEQVRQSAPAVVLGVPLDAVAQAARPAGPLRPDHLAYVVSTSGSTGRPKAIAMPHRALGALVAWQRAQTPGAPRTLQLAPLGFDVALQEVWATLAAGGTLVLVDEEERRDPRRLLELLGRRRVARLFMTPPMLEGLAAAAADGPDPAALTDVIVAGEQCRVTPAVARFVGRPGRRLHNQYGPSETHVVTAWTSRDGDEAIPALPPIGGPIDGVVAHVLDDELRPAGEGELFIGGDCLARGYLDAPGLTASRFVPDPSGDRPGQRLYRTGDLVRRLPGGGLAFAGRADRQVKVRGYRVEPAEAEAALLAHPGVESAVVEAVREGDMRLVAYLTGDEQAAAGLRAHLARTLPAYLVPARLVWLDRLPLTRNGKVDRAALPKPPRARPDLTTPYVAPATDAERTLAARWAEALGLDEVGVDDDLVDLGADSLMAMRLGAVLDHPTVRRQALAREAAPIERADDAPLSFAQERMWLLEELSQGAGEYTIALARRLRGPLDPGLLERSLAALVERHEPLRARIAQEAGRLVQRIEPAADVTLTRVELDEAAARELVATELARGHDLRRDPMLAATLVRLADDDHVLLLRLHHVAGDGWSLQVLERELGAVYAALAEGRAPDLPPLPIRYRDWARWQRGRDLTRQLDHWRAALDGLDPLVLPADRPRPPVRTGRGGTIRFTLPAAMGAAVRTVGRSERSTPFVVLLAAFQLLLARRAGRRDVAVGTPFANRARPETHDLVGLFVNTLVLRTEVHPRESFRELLRRVRATTLAAHANQDVPFERVVEELRPARDLSRTPLFQVMFVLETPAADGPRLPGVETEPFEHEPRTAKFDLTLSIREEPDGSLAGWLEYSADLFDRPAAERMAGHYRNLLAAALADPDRPVSDLDPLGDEERRLLLETWNATAEPHPHGDVVDAFGRQARRTPAATAAAWPGGWLPYAELDRESDRLASLLRARGVGPEVVVAVCLERGPAAVVSVLGVLKAGGVVLPLDPDHPDERLAFALRDAGARLVLTTARQRARFAGVEQLYLPPPVGEGRDGGRSRTSEQVSAVPPDAAAYVIYTSGSTGTPKGVVVSRRSLLAYLDWSGRAYRTGLERGSLLHGSLAVDLTVTALLGPLLRGGRVEVVSDMLDAIGPDAPGLLKVTPSHLALLGPAEGVRVLVVGGEQLTAEAIRPWRRPGTEVFNEYGPTEATVGCCLHRIEMPEGAVPIGRPVANMRAYVLDETMRPVPIGVPGELHVAGVQLARGYLGRPGLTAERFLPDPFAAEPGGRLYRTGDRCRWRSDGTLEFLGRLDGQVKVRGHRVELGEVEAALEALPGVRRAVAVARPDRDGLVAYVVGGARPAELRDHLRRRLPEPMVPSIVVPLDELPVTGGGKVDRARLPEPRPEPVPGYLPPRTPHEELLASTWAEVLGVERVGAHDDFFALGGHSLLATRVIARLRARGGVEVPLRLVFERPRLAELAESLAGLPRAREAAIRPRSRR